MAYANRLNDTPEKSARDDKLASRDAKEHTIDSS